MTRRTALTALLLALAVWVFVDKAAHRMPDLEVYWRAGARAAAGEPIYRTSDADYQFKYFPAFAVAAIPLGALPLPAAKAVWFTASVAALIALLRLSLAVLPNRRRSSAFLILVLLVGLGKYYAQDIVLGQVNTIVALAVTGAVLAFHAGRDARGGWLVALAIVLKPYALILAPWIVARGRWRAVATLAVGLALAVAVPAVVYGFDGAVALHRDWWRTVTSTTGDTLLNSRNISLASMWAKYLGIGTAATALATASSAALLLAVAIVFVKRRHVARPDGLEAGLLIAVTPLISPQGWDYVLVLATTMLVYVANDIDRGPRYQRAFTWAGIAAVGLTLYDLLGRRLLNYLVVDLGVITLGVLLLTAAVVALRFRRMA